MSTLDSSIVNVALPKMSKALNVTTSSIQLVVTSYLIVIAGTVLIFGRLGDMLGKSNMFKFGLGLFTFGSLLCGVTNSFPILILVRIVQAIGAALTFFRLSRKKSERRVSQQDTISIKYIIGLYMYKQNDHI